MVSFGKLSLLTMFFVVTISAWLVTSFSNTLVGAEDVCMEEDLDDISFEEAQRRFSLMIFPGIYFEMITLQGMIYTIILKSLY